MNTDNLDKDTDACLKFLIVNQTEWKPNIPVTLIDLMGAKEVVAPGQGWTKKLASDMRLFKSGSRKRSGEGSCNV